jgi:hypothetical protein
VLRVAVAAGVLAGVLGWAGTAQAGTVLEVDGGEARVTHDRLVPPAWKTRLPAVRQQTRRLAPRPSPGPPRCRGRSSATSTPRWPRHAPRATRSRQAPRVTSSRA